MRRKRQNGVKALGLAAGLFVGLSAPAAGAELSVAELTDMERLLARLNFDPGQIDGVVDERTRTAVRLYQEFAALPADGVPSAALLAELRQVATAFVELRAKKAEAQAASVVPAEPDPAETAAAPETAPQAPPAAVSPDTAAADGGPQKAVAAAARAAAPAEPPGPEAAPEPAQGVSIARQAGDAAPKEVAEKAAEKAPAEAAPEPAQGTGEAVELVAVLAEPEKPHGGAQAAEVVAREVAKEPTAEASRERGAEPPAPAESQLAHTEARAHEEPEATPVPAKSGQAHTEARAHEEPEAERGFDLEGVIARLVRRNGRSAERPANGRRAVDSPQGGAGRARSGGPAGAKFPATASVDRDGYDEFKKGYAAAQVGNVDLAIELYTLAIETGDLALEHLADAFYNRANAYQVRGALDYAIADYNAAILNKPDFPGAYYNRGFAFEAKGERARAVADFKKARDLGLRRLGIRSANIPPPRR